jgi:hypothetical protein
VLRPGTTELIPIDTFGDLHLADITELRLLVVDESWSPSLIVVFVNGIEVFRTAVTKTLKPGDSELSLGYPIRQVA